MNEAEMRAKYPFTMEALDRPIAFHRPLVNLTGNVASALMLGQAIYWSKRTKDPEGWFYKTRVEWEDETGMTRTEQENARKRLVSLGYLEEVRRGIPAKLFYRVNKSRFTETDRPALTVEDVLKTYSVHLSRMSNGALARATKLGVEVDNVDFREVVEVHGLRCCLCDKPILHGPGNKAEDLHFHHLKSLANGGSHTYDNIRPSHCGCNLAEGTSDSLSSLQDSSQQARSDEASRTVPVEQPLSTSETTAESTANYTEAPAEPAAGDLPNGHANTAPEGDQAHTDDPPPSAAASTAGVPNQKAITDEIHRLYQEHNPGIRVPWTKLAFVRLAREIERVRGWTTDEWVVCVRNRYASDGIILGELPESFIPYLSRYISGAVDRYGKAKGANSGNVSARTARNRAALSEVVHDIREGFGIEEGA